MSDGLPRCVEPRRPRRPAESRRGMTTKANRAAGVASRGAVRSDDLAGCGSLSKYSRSRGPNKAPAAKPGLLESVLWIRERGGRRWPDGAWLALPGSGAVAVRFCRIADGAIWSVTWHDIAKSYRGRRGRRRVAHFCWRMAGRAA
jgi:hypothetical protein